MDAQNGVVAVYGNNGSGGLLENNPNKKAATSYAVKVGLAQMLRGGVIMDVIDAAQARIAEEAGAVAVMALERVPADIRAEGGVARMSDPGMIKEIKKAVTIPVMAKARIGMPLFTLFFDLNLMFSLFSRNRKSMPNAGNRRAVRHMWGEMCPKSSSFVDSRLTIISVYSQGLGVMVRQHSCNLHLLHFNRRWSEVGLASVLFCQSIEVWCFRSSSSSQSVTCGLSIVYWIWFMEHVCLVSGWL